jgi:hypothetical protein
MPRTEGVRARLCRVRRAPRLHPALPAGLVWLASSIAAPSGRGIAAAAAQSPAIEAASSPTPGAPQQHFDEGYRLAQLGDYEGAARELEVAYRLDPHPAVLFNLARAYAASGQPVAAYDTFSEYLRRASPVDAEREGTVRRAMQIAEGRIGRLSLQVTPSTTSVEIDGQRVGSGPLQGLRLKAGRHALVLRATDMQTDVRSVDVEPGAELRLEVRLEPPPPPLQPGYLTVRCGVPDLEVRVDGSSRASTPFALPLSLPPGQHRVELTRPGYVHQSSLVRVTSAEGRELACDAAVDPNLAPSDASSVSVSLDDIAAGGRAQLSVDGRERPAFVARLPSGRHRVEVKADGYEPWHREVNLRAGDALHLTPQLELTERARQDGLSRQRQARLRGGIVAGTGLALVGTAVTLSMVAHSKHSDWSKERDALNGSSLDDDGVPERLSANDSEALTIQRLGDAAVATGLAGAVALGIGTFLWLSADGEPGVQASVTSNGASVGYGGRF